MLLPLLLLLRALELMYVYGVHDDEEFGKESSDEEEKDNADLGV